VQKDGAAFSTSCRQLPFSRRPGSWSIATGLVIAACTAASPKGTSSTAQGTDGSAGADSLPDAADNAASGGNDSGTAGRNPAAGGTSSQASAGAAGASDSSPGGDSDAGASGADSLGFVPAPHASFPLVTAHGGPVIPHIELVPVYFGDDPLREGLESFNSWVLSSDYWKTVGADYGVLPGTRLPAVQFASVPAGPISDTTIGNWIAARVADGSLPKPSASTVFALFYPSGTTITSGATSTSCAGFAGFHESVPMANAIFIGTVPFVVVPRCSFSAGDELIVATDVASHEYLEAATDPFSADLAWFMDGKAGQPLEAWQMLSGLEVADLCENQSYDVIDGFTVQDMWSNSAAQAGNDPCQPSDPKHPFFTVSANDTIYHAQPGSTVTVHATAWSNLPAPDWSIAVNWGDVPDSDFDGQASLSRATVNNGDEVTATITVPASPTMVGGRSVYRFTIDSIDPINPNFDHPWPVMIIVP
jgi:hypothetical protein